MPSEAAELRDLSDDQLLERVESAKEELFNLRFQLATGQLDNPSRIRKVRREIARVATVLREREIAAARAAAPAAETSAGGTEVDR
jgi:large subunit ribosomal protein L29